MTAMSKIIIPENLKGKDLTTFLIENKSALVAQKKMLPKLCDPISCSPAYYVNTGGVLVKSAAIASDAISCMVKVVANTSMYCDSQMDVLTRDSASKSIKERKGMIPHLHDHQHTLDAEVGDVKDIYYQDIALKDLSYDAKGNAQVLIFETDIKKSYNETVFNKYRDKKVKQHSIGLQYIKLELAINDNESEKEFDFWNKYINDIINQNEVEQKGFFWVVSEYKLLENSAVLFGSNPLTPTLEVKSTEFEPLQDTHEQPFDLQKGLKTFKLFT